MSRAVRPPVRRPERAPSAGGVPPFVAQGQHAGPSATLTLLAPAGTVVGRCGRRQPAQDVLCRRIRRSSPRDAPVEGVDMRRATSIAVLSLMLILMVGGAVSASGQTFSAQGGTGPEGGSLPVTVTVHHATAGSTFSALVVVHFATGDASVTVTSGGTPPTARTAKPTRRAWSAARSSAAVASPTPSPEAGAAAGWRRPHGHGTAADRRARSHWARWLSMSPSPMALRSSRCHTSGLVDGY